MKLWQHRSPLAFSLIADAVRSWNIRQGCLMSNSTSWMTRPIFSFYTCIFFLSLYSISSYFTSFFLPFFFLFWLLWGEFRFLYIGIGDDEDQATEFAQLLGSLFVFFLPVSLSLCLSFFLSLSLSFSFFLLVLFWEKLTFPVSSVRPWREGGAASALSTWMFSNCRYSRLKCEHFLLISTSEQTSFTLDLNYSRLTLYLF